MWITELKQKEEGGVYPKVLIDKQTISGRFHRKLAPVTVEKGCPGDWGKGRMETLTFVP